MKTQYLMLSLAFTFISLISFAQSKTDTIKVWGNCSSCKENIEGAATAAGATSANWNKTTKLLVVSYDAAKTSNMKIQDKIASVGYDTQDMKAPTDAYNKLDKCCQYERPKAKGQSAMNNMKMDDMACCKDKTACDKMDDCCKPDMTCSKDMKDATAKQDCCAEKSCAKK